MQRNPLQYQFISTDVVLRLIECAFALCDPKGKENKGNKTGQTDKYLLLY